MRSKLACYVFIIQLISVQLLFASDLNGQNLEDTRVTIQLEEATPVRVFEALERTTKFKFGYDRSVSAIEHRIDLDFKKKSLAKVLSFMEDQWNLRFRQINHNISVILNKGPQLDDKTVFRTRTFERTLTGRVEDDAGEPLPGATVQVKGTSVGTITDSEGRFTLEVPDEAEMLIVSYIGFIAREVMIGEQTRFEISLSPDLKSLEEVVVIGYGTQKRGDVTGAIAQVKAETLSGQAVTSLDQGIIGKMAGVQVLETSGAPGDNVSIRVRGTNSITAGNNPLIVVDGVPLSDNLSPNTLVPGNRTNPSVLDGGATETNVPFNPLSAISVDDIESIEVLKDAASAAIYGSRGANGVVLVTTKRGSGKPKVFYNSYVGWQQVSKKLDVLNAYDYAQFTFEGHGNAYLDELRRAGVTDASMDDSNEVRRQKLEAAGIRVRGRLLTPEVLIPYLEGEEGLTDTDWQDEVFRVAPMQNHSLAVAGTKDKVSYYASLNYFDQEGVVINSGFERYSARLNLDVDMGKLKFGVNFNPSYSIQNRVFGQGRSTSGETGIVATALSYAPVFPVFEEDGTYNFGANSLEWRGNDKTRMLNPVALAELVENDLNHTRVLGNLFAEYAITPALSYRVSLGVDVNNFEFNYFRPSTLEDYNIPGPSVPDGAARTNTYLNWLVENTLNYTRNLGQHRLAALVGYTAQKEINRNTAVFATDFPNDLVTTLNQGIVTDGSSDRSEWSLLSYIGRVQYSFQDKYLLSAAVRMDGSSRFGSGNRWGVFPSVSAGWWISEESFFPETGWFTGLKLRGSYGGSGNFQIPNYGAIALVGQSNYVTGNGGDEIEATGLTPITAANEELSWERTTTVDLGMDASFFEGALTLEIDYYRSLTQDLLLQVPVPRTSGFDQALQNLGEVENRGVEFLLSANRKFGALHVSLSGNFSANRNEVLKLGPGDTPIIVSGGHSSGQFITEVGGPIANYFTLVQDGIYTNEEAVQNNPVVEGSRGSQPGDRLYRDVNGDGVITRDGDRTNTGFNYFPDYTYGATASLAYKGIDLGVSLQGSQGGEIMCLLCRHVANLEGNFNNLQEVYDNRWVSESQPGDGQTPRPNRRATGQNIDTNTDFIEDASYLRIRNITLGYSFPSALIRDLHLSKARLYFAAMNPFTFTDYRGYNPEVDTRPGSALASGEDSGTYPLAKTYSIGINITFE